MGLVSFESLSVLQAVLIFLAAALVVYFAGRKLSVLSDDLAIKTGAGRAFIGFLLLGGVTSLPEAATTVSASAGGNASMAGGNLIGSINMQIMLLAVLNFWQKRPIAGYTSSVAVILQGLMLVMMLGFASVFIIIPSPEIGNTGLDTITLFIVFLFSLYMVHRLGGRYFHVFTEEGKETPGPVKDEGKEKKSKPGYSVAAYLKGSWHRFLALAILIFIAGYVVVNTSEVIAEETGITSSFAGYLFVAVTTSLPEVSTTIGALKLKRYDMAFSNIFGTNLLNVAMLFLADIFYRQGPVLAALDEFAQIAAAVAIVLTTIFVAGIAISSKRKILGVGYESLVIILIYLLSTLLLYFSGE